MYRRIQNESEFVSVSMLGVSITDGVASLGSIITSHLIKFGVVEVCKLSSSTMYLPSFSFSSCKVLSDVTPGRLMALLIQSRALSRAFVLKKQWELHHN